MDELLRNEDGEVVVKLTDGWTLRSGGEVFTSGEYVRLVDPNGIEYCYWDQEEWRREPALVMGAIINSAAGIPGEIHIVYVSPPKSEEVRPD